MAQFWKGEDQPYKTLRMKKCILALILLNSFYYEVSAQVGINTPTPTATLDVNGNMVLRKANSALSNKGYSCIVRDDNTGELKVIASPSGNTLPLNYITYTLNNVNGDWVNDYDTKISSSEYTVAIIGSNYTSSNNGLTAAVGTDFNPMNVFAFNSGNTWHLSADYKGATSSGGNGTWEIRCLVINNTLVKTLPNVIQNLGGSKDASATSSPSGL